MNPRLFNSSGQILGATEPRYNALFVHVDDYSALESEIERLQAELAKHSNPTFMELMVGVDTGMKSAMPTTLDNTCGHDSCKDAGTYSMPGRCANCGTDYVVNLTKGHEAPGSFLGARCPNCGCTRVRCYTPIP